MSCVKSGRLSRTAWCRPRIRSVRPAPSAGLALDRQGNAHAAANAERGKASLGAILVLLTSRYGDLDVGRINVAIECDTQLVAVEFALPPGYDEASDTVAA